MRDQRPALSGPLHVVWHITLVGFGWCLFAGFWWFVLLQKSHSLTNIIWLLSGALVLLPVITLYWVMHNRGIYARKGPRQQVQVVETVYAQDWAGRPVRAHFGQLRQARLITIHSTEDEKHFLSPPDRLQACTEAL
jgi:hypothetical protein